MAVASQTYYRATLTGQTRQKHTCVACRCVYRTAVERTVADTGGIENVARERAATRLAAELKAAANVRPCPTCGLVPPAAIVRRSRPWHAAVWGAAAIAPAAVAGLAAAGWIPFTTAAVVVPSMTGVGVLLHLFIAYVANPRRRRAAKLERARADVAAGTTEIVHPGEPGSGKEPRAWTIRHSVGIALAAVAPIALLAPAYFETSLNLPANPHLKPTIVPPGSTVVAPFPPPAFRSVHGWWTANANVKVLNADELGTPRTLPATTHPPAWGNQAWADATRSAPELNVAVTIPDDPALEGKTLQLRATLHVVYPTRMTKTAVDKDVANVTHDFPVVIAPRAEFQTIRTALNVGGATWLVGTFVGGGLLAAGLAALKRQHAPSEPVRLADAVTP
jgi:hypothetical protein